MILVIDVGTTGLRSSLVDPGGDVHDLRYVESPPRSPAPMFVEFDPAAMAAAALELARSYDGAAAGPIDAVGITNQRSSTVVWDRQTGEPVGPGISWQDVRTAGMCLSLQAQGIRLAPNESATKLAFLLDVADPARERDLCFGTIETWIAWTLSNRSVHVTDPGNAGVTGLMHLDGSGWNPEMCAALNIPVRVLPTIVESSGVVGYATALAGSPPIAGLIGDQQGALLGQGCIIPGQAKVTFGTGGMLDLCLGDDRPAFPRVGEAGTFPVIAWRLDGHITWGLESVMMSAGQAVSWLKDDLELIATPAESETVARRCDDSNGVMFVPALQGLGAPIWDFGARGTLLGLTRGAGRPEVVRAVLEGVAHRAVDLVEAAEADGAVTIERIRVDGGMTANSVFVQALANAAQRPVEVSRVREATTLGAAFLAGLAVGAWSSIDECAATWSPGAVVTPTRRADRAKWIDARERSRAWIPELTALQFF